MILILLLLPSIAYSLEYDVVFNKQVDNNANFTADDKTFYVRAFDNETVKLDFPNGKSAILTVDKCTFEDVYYACLDKIEVGGDDVFNITLQEYPLYPKIRIEKPDIDIKLERSFDRTSFLKGETANVKVVIKNDGSVSILDGEYIDEFPSWIRILSTDNCERDGNRVRWDGSLSLVKDREFSYIIKGIEGGEYNSTAVLRYGSEWITQTKIITVRGETPVSIIFDVNTTDIFLGDDIFMNITFVNNNEDYNVSKLQYKIYFPEGLKKIDKTGDITGYRNYFLFDAPLDKGESKSISFTLTSEKRGTLQIKDELKYSVGDISGEEESIYEVNVTVGELNITILKEESYKPGEIENIPVEIKSPAKGFLFKNIVLKIDSNLSSQKEKILIEKIHPGVTKTVDLSVNSSQKKGDYYLNISVEYQTYYGEDIESEARTIIRIIEEEEEKKKEEKTIDMRDYAKEKDDGRFIIVLKMVAVIAVAIFLATAVMILIFKIKKSRDKRKEIKEIEKELKEQWKDEEKK